VPSTFKIPPKRPSFLERTAISGVGYTALTKASGRTVGSLAVEACRRALDDCGLDPSEVDGIVSYSMFGDSVSGQFVATALALPELHYALDMSLGGQAPCFAVVNAALAVESGLARNVLVYRALNGRSGTRIGSTQYASPSAQYRYPLGFTAYPHYMALLSKRYMIETGATELDLASVVGAQSEYAVDNERAIRRRTVSLDEYLESPWVVEPFRVADCTGEVDGACAVVVTSLDQARELAVPPAVLRGAAWATGPGPGLDGADMLNWPDYSRNCQHYLAPRLWESSGLGPGDVEFAEIYDCFSAVVLMALEGLGIVDRGEAGAFVRGGETKPSGRLPVNTHGGLLCEGYLHGMNTLTEAALQIQGRCGSRQLRRHSACVVTSGALTDGSALVLTADR
jgi:acetyl-CoA acetyltransferase